MTERRMIRKDLWDDPRFYERTITERYLYLGIIPHSDDEGCFIATPKYLRKKLFYADDRISPAKIRDMLLILQNKDLIVLGQSKSLELGYIPNWFKMQTYPNHKGKASDYNDFLATIGVTPRWSHTTQDKETEEKKNKEEENESKLPALPWLEQMTQSMEAGRKKQREGLQKIL